MHITPIRLDTEERSKRIQTLQSMGMNPYSPEFKRSCSLQTIHKDYGNVGNEGKEIHLKLYGRVLKIQSAEQQIFIDVEDQDNQLRFILQENIATRSKIQKFRDLVFCGDWVGFSVNRIFLSQDNILTAQAYEWKILTSSILPLSKLPFQQEPHYLRLAKNVRERQKFIKSRKILRHIRNFLEDKYNFIEVNTSEFELIEQNNENTPHTGNRRDSKNRLRPEIYLKQLIIGGLEAVYEIHNALDEKTTPEFYNTQSPIIECYLSPADFNDMTIVLEQLLNQLAQDLYVSNSELTSTSLYPNPDREESLDWDHPHEHERSTFDITPVDLTQPWSRKSFFALLQGFTGTDFLSLTSIKGAIDIGKSVGLIIHPHHTFTNIGEVAIAIFNQLISPTLIQPTFVVDYPYDNYPFYKQHRHDLRLVERFEAFVHGTRIATGCSSLTDPQTHKKQLAKQLKSKNQNLGQISFEGSLGYALNYGLPPTGELKINLNQIVLLLSRQENSTHN